MTTLGADAETIVHAPRETVAPARDLRTGRRALEVLRQLSHDERGLVEEAVIGEGGMGLVTRARQVALDRAVAVKTVKRGCARGDVEALLSEAWLAGSLEHPGILPIYALALGGDGRPQLVMKHIEGVTWAHLLANDGERATYAPGASRLESHLRVAIQLCNAVHFANSRGVVHRDLKPANVMLGRFGEVYLVDWGLATFEGPSSQLAGTPAYMAPEMLGGAGSVVSARTDVYLLGSIVFEVATGQPPHLVTSMPQLVERLRSSPPPIPPEVPDELAALLRACLARRPEDRPASAAEVRRALEAFLEHQGSRELAAQSIERTEELERALADDSPDGARVARLFSECRFGFQQALRSWPGNTLAADGYARAIARMVHVELERGSVGAARALLAELPQPPAELAAAVERAEAVAAEKARELSRLQRVAERYDPLAGYQRRFVMGFVLGALWVLGPLVRLVLKRQGVFDDDLVGALPVAVLSIGVILFLERRSGDAPRTALNQQLARFLLFAMAFQVVATVVVYGLLDVRLGARGNAVLLAYWGMLAGIVAILFIVDVWPAALGYWVTALLAWRWPASEDALNSLGNLVTVVSLIRAFRRSKRELAARDRRGA
ncbi:MAG: serine/threonine protein kinase [Myxococcaceae bacterium]|nr:serine/threonine protein kinase [Myxococcaceae bacterium]